MTIVMRALADAALLSVSTVAALSEDNHGRCHAPRRKLIQWLGRRMAERQWFGGR